MLIVKRSQEDSIGRPKERNSKMKKNKDDVQSKKYIFIIIFTYEYILINYPEHTFSPAQLYTLTLIYLLTMTQYL